MEDAAFDNLESERLTIRRFCNTDAEVLAAYRDDPDVARFQGWDRPYSTLQALDFISGLQDLSPGRQGTWFQFAVCLRESDALIGDVALRTPKEGPPEGEIGFSFAAIHQGHGYATEAVHAVIRYAFDTLGMSRVFAITESRNAQARALLERLEFNLKHKLDDGICVYDYE